MFQGSIVAIATPFKNNRVDESTLKDLVEFQIRSGTKGIVPCGTTGESPTLSTAEHERVIEICIKAANRRVPVIAGTGSNSTDEAVSLTRHAAASGADACLVVSPYYNKPTQKGLYLHFKKIAESVDIPIILYNIAGRTAVNIEPSTIAELARICPNIVGVKEASGSLEQMQTIRHMAPSGFLLLSGDDTLTLPILSVGGVGVISVVANIVPADVAKMVAFYSSGKIKQALAQHEKLFPLCKAMFLETNPIPVKKAMEILGMCSSETRLPLSPMAEENVKKLRTAMQTYGLLKGKK